MTVDDSTLSGWWKERYEERGRTVVPEFSIVAEDVRFGTAQRLGDKFVFNVRLRRSHGITFHGSALEAFTLNAAVSGVTQQGEQQGSQIVIREAIAYGVVANAQGSKEAFGNAFDEVVMDVRNTASFYRELCLIYGGSSIGTIETDPGSSGGATRTGVLITKASWAPGLWAQMEGAKVDVYDAPGGTHRNPTTAITISALDFDARTMTMTGLDSELTAIAANDVIIPYGADTKWFDGLDVLVPNTGTMHNINAATYGQWLGNSISAGSGELTFKTLQDAATKIYVRCGMGNLTAYVSPYSWTDLNSDLAALRRFTDNGKGGREQGTTAIKYYGVTGTITVKPHPMVKAGEAFVVCPPYLKRVGSTDITFRLPGVEGQEPRFFRELTDSAGFEIRCYWNQALVNLKPSAHCKITSIVNSGL